jgi:hypothetical protein
MNSAHLHAEHGEQHRLCRTAKSVGYRANPMLLRLSNVRALSPTRRGGAPQIRGRLHDVAHVAHVALERALSIEHYPSEAAQS